MYQRRLWAQGGGAGATAPRTVWVADCCLWALAGLYVAGGRGRRCCGGWGLQAAAGEPSSRQIKQMIDFIKLEAKEKAHEIRTKVRCGVQGRRGRGVCVCVPGIGFFCFVVWVGG